MKGLYNLVGSLSSLVLVGILIFGLVKHNLKTVVGLFFLCCVVAAIAVKPQYMGDIGRAILDIVFAK